MPCCGRKERVRGLGTLMCCRGGPRVLIFLLRTSAGLKAGANLRGLDMKGSLLLKVQHVGSDSGKLLMVMVPLLPLLLEQLLEVRQVSHSL